MHKNKSTGFSLLEILLTLTICLIFSTAMAPTIKNIIYNHLVQNHINQLVTALHFTRFAAIKTGENVTLCSTSNNKSCGSNWEDGQIILTQNNKILRIFPPIKPPMFLTWHGSGKHNNKIVFSSMGLSIKQQGSFHLSCKKSKKNPHKIVLNRSGRVYVIDKS